jgi:hypothetical protein
MKIENRREIFKSAGRLLAMGVFVCASVGAGLKKRRLLHEGKCINQGLCNKCRAFETCGIPRARSVRSALERGNRG